VVLVGVFDQVEELLAAADLFLRPTAEAGTGLAVLEAMAAGLPVVASPISGHTEWIADSRNGLLVPPDETTLVGPRSPGCWTIRTLPPDWVGPPGKKRPVFRLPRWPTRI